MKPYTELTRRGRLRRLWRLARAALEEYGLDGAPCEFFYSAGNTLYKVRGPRPEAAQPDDGLFEPGRYLLRLYMPGWQAPEALELEMAWLAAMRGAGLPVPEPIPRLDGGWLTHVADPGVPEIRVCTLQHWIKGRLLPDRGRPEHYRAQGRLMARMHNLTQGWPLPPGHSSKRRYDWDGLFMNDPEIGLPPGECWGYLPPNWVEPFKIITRQFRQLTDAWGTGPEAYGLIHADLGLDANLLFWRGQPRPIDFDGSGFGYWVYDLAVALAHCVGIPDYARFRDALFEGYAEHRALPEAQLGQLQLFTASFYVYYTLWMVGVDHLHPGSLDEEMEQVMYRGAAFALNYVNRLHGE
ncbi:MAG: phosphotransferase [Anaerolineae bacterium]|nr:phosphotransferase [Anaerolineae bacterium]